MATFRLEIQVCDIFVNSGLENSSENPTHLISIQEASENPVFSSLVGNLTLVLVQNITTVNGTAEQLNPWYNINNDKFISINDELV